ncbi:LOW QUALITY PROTEIN: testis-expressed protein 22 [Rhynchonycteris naso]
MNNMKHLLKHPPEEKPGPQLSQEQQLPTPSSGRPEARGQPSAQSSSQQVLETQDWVCKQPESGRQGRHWSLSIEQRRRRLTAEGGESGSSTEAAAHSKVRGRGERPGGRRGSHSQPHLAPPRPSPMAPPCCLPQDILQIVAQLVSEDVDKDVLIPHSQRPAESTHANCSFRRSAPVWRHVILEAPASRASPS